MRNKNPWRFVDFIIIAMIGSMGLAVKAVIGPLAQMLSAALFIPGGTLSGGIYMMFLVIPAGLVKKPGASTLTALFQAVLVMILGTYGTHGAASLITYTLPGLAVDIVCLLLRNSCETMPCCVLAGMAANFMGCVGSNLLFFKLISLPFLLMAVGACLSGGLGGLASHGICRRIEKMDILR